MRPGRELVARPNDEGWVSAAQDGGSTAAGYDIAALGEERGCGQELPTEPNYVFLRVLVV